MYRIAYKKDLNEQVTLMKIEAPLIAKKARPGQFIIFRIDEYGERVPLTIADTDPEAGTVTIIFQKVGLSTNLLGSMNAGDSILDFVGPLGAATDLDGIKKAAVIGGGVGWCHCLSHCQGTVSGRGRSGYDRRIPQRGSGYHPGGDGGGFQPVLPLHR